MEAALSTPLTPTFVPVRAELSENSRLGSASSNPALYPVFFAAKSTTALGLQSGLFQSRIGSRSTGKERDTESGNDYFGARYYSSAMGRFMSPDWSAKIAPVPYAKLDNPQSLNLYAYVGNNPLSRVDKDGHADVLAQCKGKASCSVTVTDTVSKYHQNKAGKEVLDYTVKITTNFNLTTDSKGNVNVAANSTVANVAGSPNPRSDSQLAEMGQISGMVQAQAVGMGFGSQTTQLMSAVGIAETSMGSDRPGEKSIFKDPTINPLQLSGGRANLDLMHNIQGALNVFDGFGRSSDFNAIDTYRGFSDHGSATMSNFGADWNSISEQVK